MQQDLEETMGQTNTQRNASWRRASTLSRLLCCGCWEQTAQSARETRTPTQGPHRAPTATLTHTCVCL